MYSRVILLLFSLCELSAQLEDIPPAPTLPDLDISAFPVYIQKILANIQQSVRSEPLDPPKLSEIPNTYGFSLRNDKGDIWNNIGGNHIYTNDIAPSKSISPNLLHSKPPIHSAITKNNKDEDLKLPNTLPEEIPALVDQKNKGYYSRIIPPVIPFISPEILGNTSTANLPDEIPEIINQKANNVEDALKNNQNVNNGADISEKNIEHKNEKDTIEKSFENISSIPDNEIKNNNYNPIFQMLTEKNPAKGLKKNINVENDSKVKQNTNLSAADVKEESIVNTDAKDVEDNHELSSITLKPSINITIPPTLPDKITKKNVNNQKFNTSAEIGTDNEQETNNTKDKKREDLGITKEKSFDKINGTTNKEIKNNNSNNQIFPFDSSLSISTEKNPANDQKYNINTENDSEVKQNTNISAEKVGAGSTAITDTSNTLLNPGINNTIYQTLPDKITNKDNDQKNNRSAELDTDNKHESNNTTDKDREENQGIAKEKDVIEKSFDNISAILEDPKGSKKNQSSKTYGMKLRDDHGYIWNDLIKPGVHYNVGEMTPETTNLTTIIADEKTESSTEKFEKNTTETNLVNIPIEANNKTANDNVGEMETPETTYLTTIIADEKAVSTTEKSENTTTETNLVNIPIEANNKTANDKQTANITPELDELLMKYIEKLVKEEVAKQMGLYCKKTETNICNSNVNTNGSYEETIDNKEPAKVDKNKTDCEQPVILDKTNASSPHEEKKSNFKCVSNTTTENTSKTNDNKINLQENKTPQTSVEIAKCDDRNENKSVVNEESGDVISKDSVKLVNGKEEINGTDKENETTQTSEEMFECDCDEGSKENKTDTEESSENTKSKDSIKLMPTLY